MRHLALSRHLASVYRNLAQQANLPAVSCCSSRNLFASSPSSTSSSPRSHGPYTWLYSSRSRCLHTSAIVRAEKLYRDNILHSPHAELDIPKDLTVHDMIFEACEKHKDTLALDEYLTGRKYTYGEMKEHVIKVANNLKDMGYKKNDVVLSFTANTVDITFLMLACSSLGIWFSAANPQYTAGDLARHIQHSESKALFVGEDLADLARDVLATPEIKSQIQHAFVFGGEAEGFQPFSAMFQHPSSEMPRVPLVPIVDVHVLPYSSGTTGLPKGVMLTHHNIVSNVHQCMQFAPEDPKTALALLPFYHIYGMVAIQYQVLSMGGTLVVLPRFDPLGFLECIQDRKIQVAHLVPPLIVFMAKHPMVAGFDMSSLEIVYSGAASLGQDLTTEFLDKIGKDISIQQGYGLTETSPVVCYDHEFHPGSVGYMLPNTQGKVIDLETEKPLGPNQDGELCARGPQIMKGYYKNQEATDDMIDSEGWLHTGDIGYYTEDGIVYIKDRLKELIKFKGFQVPPAELEALLLTHPGVAEVGVIGIPDEKAGELPKAFVVRQEDSEVTEEELVKFVEENASDIKHLRGGVEFLYDLPKLPSGKILRRALREMSK